MAVRNRILPRATAGSWHLTNRSSSFRPFGPPPDVAKAAPLSSNVRAMNRLTKTIIILATIGLSFEALRLCFNAFLPFQLSLHTADPYDFTPSFNRYLLLPFANLLIFTAMAFIMSLLIRSEFWSLMLGIGVSQLYLFEAIYSGSLFLVSFSHSNLHLRLIEWAPILAPVCGVVIGCLAAKAAKKIWFSRRNRPNKGFNRTQESSGPAKPGELGGRAG
jgi:hypothetical protein